MHDHHPVAARLVVVAGIGVLLAVHFVTGFAPGIRTWGIDYWSEFSLGAGILLGVFAAAFLFPGAMEEVQRRLDRVRAGRWGMLAAAAVLAALFLVFRSRAHAYGDGYSFLGYFTGGGFPKLGAQLLTMVGDLAVHWGVYRLVVMPLGGPVEVSYAVLGAVSGLLALWAIVRIARFLTESRAGRRLIVAGALSSGAAAMWFGYVEAYVLTGAASLWALAFALEAQQEGGRLWRAWACWLIACVLHLQALALAPALVWASWPTPRGSARAPRGRERALFWSVIGFAVCGLATALYRAVMGAHVFVPLAPTADSQYTALSPAHLFDVVNHLLFVAPLGLLGVIAWLLVSRRRPEPGAATPAAKIAIDRERKRGILAVAAVGGWYFAFWVDPFLGAFRDWDLLALYGIPASLWGAAFLQSRLRSGRGDQALWVSIAAFALVHVGSFVAILQNEERALWRVERMVWEDMHYSRGFFLGERRASWAFLMSRKLQRNELAAAHLSKRAEWAPRDYVNWKNLGGVYRKMNRIDSAIVCFERAVALRPGAAEWYSALGLLHLEIGNWEAAAKALETSIARADTSLEIRDMLAQAYQQLGRAAAADSVLEESRRRVPNRPEPYFLLGAGAELAGDTAAAIGYYEAAIARRLRDEEAYARLTQLYTWSGSPDRAVAVARHWEEEFPASPNASLLLGTTYVTMQRFDSADAVFRRLVARVPEHRLATYYLATTSRHLGRPDEARRFAQRAAQLDTSFAWPWLELTYLAADAGDRAGAAAAAREYLRRAPQDSGNAYFRQLLQGNF